MVRALKANVSAMPKAHQARRPLSSSESFCRNGAHPKLMSLISKPDTFQGYLEGPSDYFQLRLTIKGLHHHSGGSNANFVVKTLPEKPSI